MLKIIHVCYLMLGVAVARWIYHREGVVDPVPHLRDMGLL